MSIKWNTSDVTTINWGTSDVKVVKYDDNGTLKNVWAKPLTLSITTNTGVSLVVVKRTASLLDEVPINVNLSNGATIYYGDTLQVTSTAQTYYTINGTNPYTISVTDNTNVSPTATRNTNTITFTKNSNIASITITYYNTSGTQVTTTYTNSATITAQQGTAYSWSVATNTGYTASQSSGSGTLTSNITISPTASLTAYTITFAKGGSNYGSWGSSTKTAYYGDRLTRSGNSVICEYYYANLEQWVERWTNTFTNGSATGYTYSVSYSSISTPVSSNQTITATTSRTANTYTISYVMNGGTHSGSYATSYTFSSSNQTKNIGTATRSGYNLTSVTTNVGTISGSTLTIPANTTGTITITFNWEVAFVIQAPTMTGERIDLPKNRYNSTWTITNPNDVSVTCYYKWDSNAYQSTTISAGGTYSFRGIATSLWTARTGYAYFEAQGQTSTTTQYTVL